MPVTRAKEFVGLQFEQCLARVRGVPVQELTKPNDKGDDVDASDFVTLPKPAEILDIYNRGFQGIRTDSLIPEEHRKYREWRAASPTLYEVFPWARDIGKGRINTPYLANLKQIPGWGGLNAQVQGDCTVHGTQHAAEVDYCNDSLWGQAKFLGQLAFENIYRSRGFNGDGWSCEAPCAYIGPNGKGGLLYRKVYENGSEKVDLTKYNSSWQSNGKAGVPSWLEAESAKNKAKWIIPIRTLEELRDAHAMGFGTNICSGQGFSSGTDNEGVAKASGGWSHAMCSPASINNAWAAKHDDICPMIQNSWGNWNSRSGKPPGAPDMPTGSFYAKGSVVARMLSGDDSYAICSVWGFERVTWEAFVTLDFIKQMQDSTIQDYFKTRQEKIVEQAISAADFNALAT
jgi:hypothetical protein